MQNFFLQEAGLLVQLNSPWNLIPTIGKKVYL
jgi:hypothetical protein